MAYGSTQIYPSDLQPNTGNGINLPFNNEAVFSSNYTFKQSVKYNLLNWLLTNPGERIFGPIFGFGLRTFIFEQINSNNLDSLKERLSDEIANIFFMVVVENITLTGNSDLSSVTLTLEFSIANTNDREILTATVNQ
jgi:phage baseplate assembly protein W